MDLFSRKIVGWAVRDHMQVELASAALTMAVNQRRPQDELIHHSDRGVQYASRPYRNALTRAGIAASMSRKGQLRRQCPDGKLFHTSKTELVHPRDYKTAPRPSATSLPSSRASTTEQGSIPHSDISPRSRWS